MSHRGTWDIAKKPISVGDFITVALKRGRSSSMMIFGYVTETKIRTSTTALTYGKTTYVVNFVSATYLFNKFSGVVGIVVEAGSVQDASERVLVIPRDMVPKDILKHLGK